MTDEATPQAIAVSASLACAQNVYERNGSSGIDDDLAPAKRDALLDQVVPFVLPVWRTNEVTSKSSPSR